MRKTQTSQSVLLGLFLTASVGFLAYVSLLRSAPVSPAPLRITPVSPKAPPVQPVVPQAQASASTPAAPLSSHQDLGNADFSAQTQLLEPLPVAGAPVEPEASPAVAKAADLPSPSEIKERRGAGAKPAKSSVALKKQESKPKAQAKVVPPKTVTEPLGLVETATLKQQRQNEREARAVPQETRESPPKNQQPPALLPLEEMTVTISGKQAWVQVSPTRTIPAKEGDVLPGLGKVVKIRKNEVVTEQGTLTVNQKE